MARVSQIIAASAYEAAAPRERQTAALALGLDVRGASEGGLAADLFFSMGMAAGFKMHPDPLAALMEALTYTSAGMAVPHVIPLPKEVTKTGAEARRMGEMMEGLSPAQMNRLLRNIGREGQAGVGIPALALTARIFYSAGSSGSSSGGTKLRQITEELEKMDMSEEKTAAGALTLPAGARVSETRLDLHKRASARASRDGIPYADAAQLEAVAGAVTLPRGARVDAGRLDLHKRASARASRDGIPYADAVEAEAAGAA